MLMGMNRLSSEDRTKVLHLLLEGNSLRAASRIADISYNTVCKLFVDAGCVAAVYQDEVLRDLPCKRLQLDEIWSFVYAKQKNVKGSKAAPSNAGDAWTWVAIDADTKLVPSWRVGDRSSDTARDFVADLASRLRNGNYILSSLEFLYSSGAEYPRATSPNQAKSRATADARTSCISPAPLEDRRGFPGWTGRRDGSGA